MFQLHKNHARRHIYGKALARLKNLKFPNLVSSTATRILKILRGYGPGIV